MNYVQEPKSPRTQAQLLDCWVSIPCMVVHAIYQLNPPKKRRFLYQDKEDAFRRQLQERGM